MYLKVDNSLALSQLPMWFGSCAFQLSLLNRLTSQGAPGHMWQDIVSTVSWRQSHRSRASRSFQFSQGRVHTLLPHDPHRFIWLLFWIRCFLTRLCVCVCVCVCVYIMIQSPYGKETMPAPDYLAGFSKNKIFKV